MKFIYLVLSLCILAATPTGLSQQENSQIVNLMIDVSMSVSPTEEQSADDRNNIANVYNAMIKDRIPSTMFLTEDVSSSDLVLYLTQLGLYGDIEFAMAGNHSDEKLSAMSYKEQLAILESANRFASAAHVCGKNEKPIRGYKPLSFDQNMDTYKALDDLGIEYNAGFQAGIIYVPGHEDDVWPYPVEGHNFYAVPISSYMISDRLMPLQDSYFEDNSLGADRWYDALAAKFNETRGKDAPLVISLTTSISGNGDYLDALKRFIALAKSENAAFVNTTQLVDMTRAGVDTVSAIPVRTGESAACPECDQKKSAGIEDDMSIGNASAGNESASNETLTIFVDMYNTTS